MIYADASFLFSLYAWDGNTLLAQKAYDSDRRRPLFFTPWQSLELRNAVRLAAHRLIRAGETVPFQIGAVFKRIDEDLSAGRLRHRQPDTNDTLTLAEQLSAEHTEKLGSAAVDLWHVSAALILRADTFWTFDTDQRRLALATKGIRRVPDLRPSGS
jgi:hypothetical protein